MASPSIETIRRVPLFSDLEQRELTRLADAFKERRFRAGHAVATEGETGAGFFIVGEGTAEVTISGATRAKLGPGDYFGEIALIDPHAKRTATITAETDMTCYGLTVWEFRPIVENDGRIAWKLLQALAHKVHAAEQRAPTQ